MGFKHFVNRSRGHFSRFFCTYLCEIARGHGFIDHNGFNIGNDFFEDFLIVHGTGLLSEKEKLMVKSIVSQTERNENNKCAKKCTKKYSVCNELRC